MRIKNLGLIPYEDAYQKMLAFTQSRQKETEDEIWFCEHPPVFTLGWHGSLSHIIDAHNIPIISTDRGGQVTYHGPGQLMMYFLIDLKRKKQGIANFVCCIEQGIISTLKDFGITAHLRQGMPGVYVDNRKICSIGLRVKKGCTYHGLALNVAMDLAPFHYIHPCGYHDLKMTQIQEWVKGITMVDVINAILRCSDIVPTQALHQSHV